MAGHSQSRQDTQIDWPGHCWRRWCPTGLAHAGMGDTWRFQWAAQWQSGDSFLCEGQENATIRIEAGWWKLTLILFLFFCRPIYIYMCTGVDNKGNFPLAQRVAGTIVVCGTTNVCEYESRKGQVNTHRQRQCSALQMYISN